MATGRSISSRLPLVSDTLEASVCTTATASTVTVLACDATFKSTSMRFTSLGGHVERLVFGLLKAGRGHGELIVSDLSVNKLIRAVRVGYRRTNGVGPCVDKSDRSPSAPRCPMESFTVPSTVPKVDWP